MHDLPEVAVEGSRIVVALGAVPLEEFRTGKAVAALPCLVAKEAARQLGAQELGVSSHHAVS